MLVYQGLNCHLARRKKKVVESSLNNFSNTECEFLLLVRCCRVVSLWVEEKAINHLRGSMLLMMIMSKGLSQKINECSGKYSSCLFDDFKRSLLQPVKKVIYQRNFTMLISCQEFFQNMLLWIFTIFSKTSNGKTVSGLLNKIEVNCSARFPMLLPPLL